MVGLNNILHWIVPAHTVEPVLPGEPFPFPDPSEFSWVNPDLHTSVVVGVLLLTAAYLWGGYVARKKYALSEAPLNPWRTVAFATSMFFFMLVENGPLHMLSDFYLFSAHMVQHLVLAQIVPPLLLLAFPGWMFRPLVKKQWTRTLGSFLAKPVIAFVISTFVLAVWHVPFMYESAMRNHDIHITMHLTFLVASVIMWFPIVNPVPDLIDRPQPIWQMVYLFLTTVPMAMLGMIIVLAENVLYPFYAEAPRIFQSIDPKEDQVIGGLIMWVIGGMLPWFAISRIFFAWYHSETDGAGVGRKSANTLKRPSPEPL